MEMKWHSFPPFAAGKENFLTFEPLSLDELVSKVRNPEHGAVVTFSGCVRPSENGRLIDSITYEAYEKMAEMELKKIIEEANECFQVACAVSHRLGKVPAGEASLIVACSGSHRKETFSACQLIVEKLKENVPIWKKEFGWRSP